MTQMLRYKKIFSCMLLFISMLLCFKNGGQVIAATPRQQKQSEVSSNRGKIIKPITCKYEVKTISYSPGIKVKNEKKMQIKICPIVGTRGQDIIVRLQKMQGSQWYDCQQKKVDSAKGGKIRFFNLQKGVYRICFINSYKKSIWSGNAVIYAGI